MGRGGLIVLSVLLWWLTSGVATATTSPAKMVQQFIDAHLKGNFAAARSFTLEQVNLSVSLFSSWILENSLLEDVDPTETSYGTDAYHEIAALWNWTISPHFDVRVYGGIAIPAGLTKDICRAPAGALQISAV